MNQLRCLVLDIETSPMLASVFGRKDVNISVKHIVRDWEIMAWSAKWLGEKKVYYRDTRNCKSDFEILVRLRDLLDAADVIITQNGQSFDSRKINARLIHHGMRPPSPYRHLDTYRIARRVADFTSFSLEYLADKLCTKYKKLKHSKFPGMILWDECLKGNVKAWEEMKRYNIRDTLATEELYEKLKAWVPDGMPKPYLTDRPDVECQRCGYKGKMIKWGYKHVNHARYQRYMCPKCSSYHKGEKC